ncbi:MAG: DUF2207 domain-containing protein [Chloroflexota bacterium]|nr:DUF2207 domain-containing protein [Chloroflexota bacterium]
MDLRRFVAGVLGAVLVAALALCGSRGALAQQQGWAIDTFHADIAVRHDTSLLITETIGVDFGALPKHGIFREIPVAYAYDATHTRTYGLDVLSVTDAAGTPWPYTAGRSGPNVRIRIGDPGRTVTGRQTYRITYRVRNAMNPFPDHDELYWNVTGALWPVPIARASATVTLAGGGFERARCFEGVTGSTEGCRAGIYDHTTHILYGASRPLSPDEQLTIVAAVKKGVLAAPVVRLERTGPRGFRDYFAVNRVTAPIALLGALAAIVFVSASWWRGGRDRVYTSIYYLSKNPEEETRPPFHRDAIVVEYTPPEDLRPAQMGLLLDERTDNKDVTATIIDLAVRGFITITEVPKEGLLARSDWRIARKNPHLDDLKPYERTILKGLLGDRDEADLSALRTDYTGALGEATSKIYDKAVRSGWFVRSPDAVRSIWRWRGAGVLAVSIAVIWGAAYFFNAGVAALPGAILGVLLIATAGWMPKRTAKGSELLRRILGFRLYIETAEKRRQEFNEKADIFAAYLPYAIVFGCVSKWARVFGGVDTAKVTAGWYSGPSALSAMQLSAGLQALSSSLSSAGFNSLVATPGASGHSGFWGGGFGGGMAGGFGGGGFAGGGGGGGGGGAW